MMSNDITRHQNDVKLAKIRHFYHFRDAFFSNDYKMRSYSAYICTFITYGDLK